MKKDPCKPASILERNTAAFRAASGAYVVMNFNQYS